MAKRALSHYQRRRQDRANCHRRHERNTRLREAKASRQPVYIPYPLTLAAIRALGGNPDAIDITLEDR